MPGGRLGLKVNSHGFANMSMLILKWTNPAVKNKVGRLKDWSSGLIRDGQSRDMNMNMGGEILIMPLNEENLKEEDTERRDDESGPDYLRAVGEAAAGRLYDGVAQAHAFSFQSLKAETELENRVLLRRICGVQSRHRRSPNSGAQ